MAKKAQNSGKGPPDEKKSRKIVTDIEGRIPGMTDEEIQSLHANAERLAVSGTPPQQAEALRLLPAIAAEAAVRKAAHTAALQAKRVAQREARQAAKRPAEL